MLIGLVTMRLVLLAVQRFLRVDVAQQAGVFEQAGAKHVLTVHFAAVLADEVFVERGKEPVIREYFDWHVAVLCPHQRIAEINR